jgi:outer membrane protein assembly factor BamB
MPRSRSTLLLALFPLVTGWREPCAGADWPGWRGPGGRGVSAEEELPVRWSASENLLWELELPRWGNSSPAVIGERLYLTAQNDDSELLVIAVDRRRGAIAWKHGAGRGRLKAHQLHNMATPTPVAEVDRVWALFGTGDLVALDRDGKPLWQRNLTAEHGEYQILWGMGSSPLLFGDKLFLICLHQGPSYVLAVDKHTGKDVWKMKRDLPCVGEATDSYSSPVLAEFQGRAELIVSGADHVNAYDPRAGKELWISSGLKIAHEYGRSITSPAAAGDLVVAASSNFSNLGRVIAVRAGGEGDVSESRRLWSYEKLSPDCPTPVCYRGLVYLVRDDGVGSCLDASSGEVKWSRRLFRGDVKASPVAGAGKVYFTSLRGDFQVIRAGSEGELLAENRLEGEFIASPALSDGAIYVRTKDRLYAIGSKREER